MINYLQSFAKFMNKMSKRNLIIIFELLNLEKRLIEGKALVFQIILKKLNQ